MMPRLLGKVAIVTGGSQGIGLAYARRLAEEDAHVVIADLRNPSEKLSSWPNRIQQKVTFHRVDVRAFSDVADLADSTVNAHRRIDILINNAAIFTKLERKPFWEHSTRDWEEVLSVNVTGVFHCIKAVIPYMKEQRSGKIINISSDVVFKGLPLLAHYVASKGAVLALTRALARELGPFNITVNALAPGLTIHEASSPVDFQRDHAVRDSRALTRTQTPEDLLGALVFFASEESDFITGQTLVVDGGEVFH